MGKCAICSKETENFDLDHYYCEECVKIAYKVFDDLNAVIEPFIANGTVKVYKSDGFL